MTAQEMFKKIGFILAESYFYICESPTDKLNVYFNEEIKSYCVTWSRWIPRIDNWYKDVYENKDISDWITYCSKYGYWQSQTLIDVDLRLFKAIHQQMKELGWLDA
ncbi:hypothetical protein ACWG0P_07215 [Amedibacillus sp. YH-ame6]